MIIVETVIIAIFEGLTEFLPVSSTGHMIITQALLGVESTEFVKAFTVNIQFGAILAVVVLYWQRFFKLNDTSSNYSIANQSKWKQLLYKFDFYVKLFVAFASSVYRFFCWRVYRHDARKCRSSCSNATCRRYFYAFY